MALVGATELHPVIEPCYLDTPGSVFVSQMKEHFLYRTSIILSNDL